MPLVVLVDNAMVRVQLCTATRTATRTARAPIRAIGTTTTTLSIGIVREEVGKAPAHLRGHRRITGTDDMERRHARQ